MLLLMSDWTNPNTPEPRRSRMGGTKVHGSSKSSVWISVHVKTVAHQTFEQGHLTLPGKSACQRQFPKQGRPRMTIR